MFKVCLYSLLLIVGLVLSQLLPRAAGTDYTDFAPLVRALTMTALAFIMIHVGCEFDIDKRRLGSYAWDYVVAMTAAAFPWLFCALYFVFVMAPPELWSRFALWTETLLVSRFASPTSAGVLFSMLAAAGLATTWVYRKAQILAIFDDVDTILFLIPLQMLMVGARWQLGVMAVVIAVLLWVAWRYLHVLALPRTWPWVLAYALGLALICEGVLHGSKLIDPVAPIHIEVLLPAFVLGCTLARSRQSAAPESSAEQRASTIISAAFMLLAGLSMPLIEMEPATHDPSTAGVANPYDDVPPEVLAVKNNFPGWGVIAWHVTVLWLLSNLGKMFPALCYRREATWRERLALGVSMFPRGEVGTAVLVISLSYGVSGPALTVATLTLCANLFCTGIFIMIVRRLLRNVPVQSARDFLGLPAGAVLNLLDILRAYVNQPGGLNYVVFLPKAPANNGPAFRLEEDNPSGVSRSLDDIVRHFGIDHSGAEQMRCWKEVIPEVHRSFLDIESRSPRSDGEAPMSVSRLVLDVEMGGLLYAVVGDHGWVFAATLYQEAMNTGRAERALVEIVREVRDALERS